MSKAQVFTEDHFWSCVKRRSMNEVLEIMFTQGNCPLAAEVAKGTTRLTDASITRMRDALAKDLDGEVETEDVEEVMAKEVEPETDRISVADIKELVATGKKKNIKEAKKAFKAQFAKDHPEYKELKKLFKNKKEK